MGGFQVSEDVLVKMLGSLALERPVRALLDLLQGEAKGLPQCCNLVTVEPERRFVTADDPVECIWILLQGKVKAKEEYPSGDVYVFRKFTAPEVFGEMEALADLATFRATLVSETRCTFLVLPVPVYVEILKSNPRYLYTRAKFILKNVLAVQKSHRLYMRLEAADRIKLYFVQYYRMHGGKGQCLLRLTRQQLADETGYSVRTINLVIRELKEAQLITQRGHTIAIDHEQYEKLLAGLDDLVTATALDAMLPV